MNTVILALVVLVGFAAASPTVLGSGGPDCGNKGGSGGGGGGGSVPPGPSGGSGKGCGSCPPGPKGGPGSLVDIATGGVLALGVDVAGLVDVDAIAAGGTKVKAL